jgi:hypothetical protein
VGTLFEGKTRPTTADNSPSRPFEDPKAISLREIVVLFQQILDISLAVEWLQVGEYPWTGFDEEL